MRIAFCDDEERCREELSVILDEYIVNNKDKDIIVKEFVNAADLMEEVGRKGGFDIYILDIVMPETDGIKLGKWLRSQGHNGKIIYLTSSEEYAIASYSVRAFNYILKPIDKKIMFEVLDEIVREIITKKELNMIIKTKGNNSILVNFDNIMYAELCRRVIVYHLSDGEDIESVTVRTTFSEAVQELLRDKRFVLCGMIVNLQHITMVDNETLNLKDIHKIYLSKKVCRDVRSAWYDFWFDGEGDR